MNFLDITYNLILSNSAPTSIMLFLASILFLIIGIGLTAWRKAFKLSSFDTMDLRRVEQFHPHIPSGKRIIIILLSVLCAMVIGMYTVQGIFPFNDPYNGLNILSFMVLTASFGIIAELQWKNAGNYAASFIVGSAMAYLSMGFMQLLIEAHHFNLWWIAITVVASSVFLYMVAAQQQQQRVANGVISILSLLIWVGIFFLFG